jgi:hypothetical protein
VNDDLTESCDAAPAIAPTQRRWAVRRPSDDAGARALAEHLAQRGGQEVRYFEAYDDDRLNRELCSGRYEGVLFADLDALCQGVWKGHAQLDRWLAAGVQIEICDPSLAPVDLQHVIQAVHASWRDWQRAQRGRQVAAAVVLCLMAVAAMAAMVWLIPAAG